MNRLTFAFLFMLSSIHSSFAVSNYLSDKNLNKREVTTIEREMEHEKVNRHNKELLEQRMEELPSSTTLGGSRGGNLDIEQARDNKLRQEEEKQKQLYEYEHSYRKGL